MWFTHIVLFRFTKQITRVLFLFLQTHIHNIRVGNTLRTSFIRSIPLAHQSRRSEDDGTRNWVGKKTKRSLTIEKKNYLITPVSTKSYTNVNIAEFETECILLTNPVPNCLTQNTSLSTYRHPSWTGSHNLFETLRLSLHSDRGG